MTETRVLRRSRLKSALSVSAAIAFVAIGLLMVSGRISDSSRYSPEFLQLIGWICIVCFGGAGLLALYNLVRPSEIVLTADGFQVKGVRRTPLVPWRHVRQFFIVQVHSSKLICYELDREQAGLQQAGSFGRTGAWGDGQIPAHLELHPAKVLELLEDWHRRYAA